MRVAKRESISTVIVLAGVLLLTSQATVCRAVTITKCKMTDKTHSTEVTSGYADSDIAVEFKGAATCTCYYPLLMYTWYFGDGYSGPKKLDHDFGSNPW